MTPRSTFKPPLAVTTRRVPLGCQGGRRPGNPSIDERGDVVVASGDGAHPSGGSTTDLRAVVQRALAQFTELSGAQPEQVCGLRSTEEGWSILVEVMDVERVPSTTSVLSTYRIDVNADAELIGYERVRRYTRSATDPR